MSTCLECFQGRNQPSPTACVPLPSPLPPHMLPQLVTDGSNLTLGGPPCGAGGALLLSRSPDVGCLQHMQAPLLLPTGATRNRRGQKLGHGVQIHGDGRYK